MPTSATGTDRSRRAGFTLVELLVVLTILGLCAGVVVATAPDPRPSLREEAERFAVRLSRAGEEAVLSNRRVAAVVDAQGFRFERATRAGWTDLTATSFRPGAWDSQTRLVGLPAEAAARVEFEPTGSAEPAAFVLAREGRQVVVRVDEDGKAAVDAPR